MLLSGVGDVPIYIGRVGNQLRLGRPKADRGVGRAVRGFPAHCAEHQQTYHKHLAVAHNPFRDNASYIQTPVDYPGRGSVAPSWVRSEAPRSSILTLNPLAFLLCFKKP